MFNKYYFFCAIIAMNKIYWIVKSKDDIWALCYRLMIFLPTSSNSIYRFSKYVLLTLENTVYVVCSFISAWQFYRIKTIWLYIVLLSTNVTISFYFIWNIRCRKPVDMTFNYTCDWLHVQSPVCCCLWPCSFIETIWIGNLFCLCYFSFGIMIKTSSGRNITLTLLYVSSIAFNDM